MDSATAEFLQQCTLVRRSGYITCEQSVGYIPYELTTLCLPDGKFVFAPDCNLISISGTKIECEEHQSDSYGDWWQLHLILIRQNPFEYAADERRFTAEGFSNEWTLDV